MQGDFETSIKNMLECLGGLWAQLEELHTGVTLTKEGSSGCRDLALAQTGVKVCGSGIIIVSFCYKSW